MPIRSSEFVRLLRISVVNNTSYSVLRKYPNPSIHVSPAKTYQTIQRFMQEAVISPKPNYFFSTFFDPERRFIVADSSRCCG